MEIYKILMVADFSGDRNSTVVAVSDFLERQDYFSVSKIETIDEVINLLEKMSGDDLPNCIITNFEKMIDVKKDKRLNDIVVLYLYYDPDTKYISAPSYLNKGFDNVLAFDSGNTIEGRFSRISFLKEVKDAAELNFLRRKVKLLENS